MRLTKNSIISALTTVSIFSVGACAPSTIQSVTAASSTSGNTAYSVTGYTKLNETKKDDANRYALEFGKSMCPQAVDVKRVDTLPAKNGFGPFLYWQAIVECPSASPSSRINLSAYNKCIGWLEKSYKSFRKLEDIDEYEFDGKYVYKGNVEVTPYTAPTIEIGYECIYVAELNKLTGLVELTPIPPLTVPHKSLADSKPQQVRFGFSACPTIEPWKVFVDEMARKNYKAELPASCIWMKEGDLFYEIGKTITPYKQADFLTIKLPSGRTMWIEASNIK